MIEAYILLIVRIYVEPSYTRAFLYFIPLYPHIALRYFLFVPILFLMYFPQLSGAFVISACFHLDSSPSQSCFFMPCAPQSITEIDQVFVLFLGLFSFIVVEIVVPRARKFRKQRRERRLFEQEVERRIEMGRSGAQGYQSPSIALNSSVISRNESTHPSRVNSGIVAEEGRGGR